MKRMILGLLVLATGCGSKSTGVDEKEKLSINDTPLIDRLEFEDLEGNEISIKSLEGKTIFINFWATWCKPCIKEMPSIATARGILKDENVVFVVASDEEIKKIKKFATKYSFGFPYAHSKPSVFDLDIKALPTTMIISPDGNIVFNEVGARDWAAERNIELIKSFTK